VDFELQKEIWDRAFGKHFLKVRALLCERPIDVLPHKQISPKCRSSQESTICVSRYLCLRPSPLWRPRTARGMHSSPPGAPINERGARHSRLELVFEEYGFKSLFCCSRESALLWSLLSAISSPPLPGSCPDHFTRSQLRWQPCITTASKLKRCRFWVRGIYVLAGPNHRLTACRLQANVRHCPKTHRRWRLWSTAVIHSPTLCHFLKAKSCKTPSRGTTTAPPPTKPHNVCQLSQ